MALGIDSTHTLSRVTRNQRVNLQAAQYLRAKGKRNQKPLGRRVSRTAQNRTRLPRIKREHCG